MKQLTPEQLIKDLTKDLPMRELLRLKAWASKSSSDQQARAVVLAERMATAKAYGS